MIKLAVFTLAIFVILQSAGCNSDVIKRAGYEALYQNQCMRDKGVPDCDPRHLNYDEYKKMRELELQGDRLDK